MTTANLNYQRGKPPLAERINFRVVAIVALFSLLVGVPSFKFVKGQLNHGVEKTGDRFDVNLRALGNFRFDDQTGTLDNIPPTYRKLDGQRVALEGFIAPPDSAAPSVGRFQFVYNVQKCCFGGPPLVQERVFAQVPNAQTIEYTNAEIRIIGTLHVSTDKDEVGKIEQVYSMDVDSVEPL